MLLNALLRSVPSVVTAPTHTAAISAAISPYSSIVTPCFNMAKYLPEAIESVLRQNYPRIEYIVIDGGSKDGTLDILERYKDRLRYVSGPDRGPSDATYKGLRQAHGEVLGWLNADDSYLPGAIRKAVEYFQTHPATDVIYGEGWWIDETGATIGRCEATTERQGDIRQQPERLRGPGRRSGHHDTLA